MAGITENNVAYADVCVTGTTVTTKGENSPMNCIVTAAVDVKAFRKNTVICVKDAFSKKYVAEKTQTTLVYDKNIYSVSKIINCSIEDSVAAAYTPVYSFVNIGRPFVDSKDGKNLLKAKVRLTAIVLNSGGEYESFGKNGEITIDIGKAINPEDKYFINCVVQNKNIIVNGEKIKVDFTVDASGFVVATEKATLLENFAEDTEMPIEKKADSLVLYYGKKGEKIFDIAMKCSTDINEILTENNLATPILDNDKMLIVPSFGM